MFMADMVGVNVSALVCCFAAMTNVFARSTFVRSVFRN